jgi:hypothetical protein
MSGDHSELATRHAMPAAQKPNHDLIFAEVGR